MSKEMSEIAKRMAEIFEVPASIQQDDSGSDYDVFSAGETDTRSFDEKAHDLQTIIEKESEEVEKEISSEEIIKRAATKYQKPEQEAIDITKKVLDEENGGVKDIVSENNTKEKSRKKETIQLDAKESFDTSELNPYRLKLYNFIKNKYGDKFQISGSPLMRPFYEFKIEELAYLLSKYPLLDCNSLQEEISNIDTNHSISGMPNAATIAEKMNLINQERHRLSEILVQIHKQYHIWHAALEMMKGKLWCIKDVKGQHKREGIVADYMADVVHYVSGLQCTLKSAEYIDNILIAAANSISRQLECIKEEKRHDMPDIDNLSDDLLEGEKIEKPTADVGHVGKTNFGGENDEFSEVG